MPMYEHQIQYLYAAVLALHIICSHFDYWHYTGCSKRYSIIIKVDSNTKQRMVLNDWEIVANIFQIVDLSSRMVVLHDSVLGVSNDMCAHCIWDVNYQFGKTLCVIIVYVIITLSPKNKY